MKLELNLMNLKKKFIIYLILITPLIDLFNGLIKFEFNYNYSPGVVIRTGILIIIMIMYVTRKKYNIVKFLFIVSLFLLQLWVNSLCYTLDIKGEFSFISKIYYYVFLLYLYMDNQEDNKKLKDQIIDSLVIVNMIVSSSLMITKMLGIGISSYGELGGYKGLYMGLNDVTAVAILTFPFVVYSFIVKKEKFKYGVYSILSAINIVLLGTKTAFVCLAIIFLYFLWELFWKQKQIGKAFMVLIPIIIFILIFKKYFWDLYSSSILVRLKFFIKDSDITTFALSGRNNTMMGAMLYWKSNIKNIFLGVGYTDGARYIGSFLTGHGLIEMDFFDILYFYGIILTSIIFIPILKILFKSVYILFKGKEIIERLVAYVYILGTIILFLGGHVIVSPLASVYFIVIYGLVDNIDLRKA